MTFETFLAQQLETRIRQRRLLVVYDPDQRFRDIVASLRDKYTQVLDCDGDLLEAREAALESFAALGEDASCKQKLVLYVPAVRSLEDADRCSDPFAGFVVAGACFPDGAGDDFRQLCLQFLPEQAGQIEEIFASGEPPAISLINSMRSGAVDSPMLRDLLKAEGPKDMLVKFLSASDETLKKLRSTTQWVKDLKDLVARTLGLKLDGAKEAVEDLQTQLWRYLLFSEFAADLPVTLPAGLQSVPRAGISHEPFVRSLCGTLRDLGSAQAAYEEAANRVAGTELGLEAQCGSIEDFGVLDTFSFEERGFLRRFAEQLGAGQFENAREIVALRQGSFWVERDAQRSAEWQVADLSARLMLELQSLEAELTVKRSLDEWIDFYTSRFGMVDTIHRCMEQVAAEILPIEAVLAGVLTQAREAHREACDKLARGMQEEATKTGWPSTTKARSVDIFDRWVEPRWKSGERVAYFWIDALRYELAQALEAALGTHHGTRLDMACASLPCLTPVGMAALLPGASSMEIKVDAGKPVAVIYGKPVDGPKARAEVLASYVGASRTRLVDLEDLANGKLPNDIEMIEVLAVKTNDIDSLGESNPLYFIGMLPSILRKIQLAVNKLAEAGFTRAILTSDHGFAWMQSTSAGNAIGKPPGQWVMAKDRVLLGEGTTDTLSLVLNTSDAGIRSSLQQIAIPKGMATYTAGVTYFHGGISPQECILPVLDVHLKTANTMMPTHRVDITLTYRGASRGTITSLIPALELSYPAADLFGPASVCLLLHGVDKSGTLVGEAASSAAVDPASREIHLERGKAIKVPLRLKEGFEGEFKVVAIDPVSGTTYATIKLETAFHH
ncbi:PglZ domain-containing protein [Prosthecobacter sp. SYSU 5D2]|uniref:PglZ domain-containing protein n=1 Tax=Prosthecobacter sp. SYSU 5D2 TaxID=3134134 RepID=UPI0031FE6D45